MSALFCLVLEEGILLFWFFVVVVLVLFGFSPKASSLIQHTWYVIAEKKKFIQELRSFISKYLLHSQIYQFF